MEKLRLKGFKVHELPAIANVPAVHGRRDFYKMGVVTGEMTIAYGGQVLEIQDTVLFFVNPRVPRSVIRRSKATTGYACIFTEAFMPAIVRKSNGDKLRLEQVIFNLLTNAVKYSPQGSKITISLSQDEKIRCSVSDERIGVPAARQQLIFEKFSRGHDASQKYAGLGLGLFISRQIVRRHDGEIGLTSSPG